LTALRAEGCGIAIGHALKGVKVQRVQKVHRVQRVAVSPSAMSFIVSVTGFTLCHPCCTTKSKSPQGGGAVRRRRNSVSSFLIFFGVPQGSAQLLPEEGALRYGNYFCVISTA
jgi:hypothetical protein